MNNHFVFDTDSLISATLITNSVSRKALDKAIDMGRVAVSNKTRSEFVEVLFRKKFDKCSLHDNERWDAIDEVEKSAILYNPDIIITDCRDPKDNRFLELATCAKVSCIITSDDDLLILNLYRNILIINASNFVNQFSV